MDNYIVKFIGGSETKITAEDYKNIIGKNGLVFIKSTGETLNTSSISRIISEERYNLDLRENRVKSIRGVLHTGERAIRYWGQWYLDDGSYLDDPKTGLPTKPEKILDPRFYPEVARDCVPTPEEYYKNYEQLPQTKRLEAIMGVSKNHERLASGFQKLSEAFKQIDSLGDNQSKV